MCEGLHHSVNLLSFSRKLEATEESSEGGHQVKTMELVHTYKLL